MGILNDRLSLSGGIRQVYEGIVMLGEINPKFLDAYSDAKPGWKNAYFGFVIQAAGCAWFSVRKDASAIVSHIRLGP